MDAEKEKKFFERLNEYTKNRYKIIKEGVLPDELEKERSELLKDATKLDTMEYRLSEGLSLKILNLGQYMQLKLLCSEKVEEKQRIGNRRWVTTADGSNKKVLKNFLNIFETSIEYEKLATKEQRLSSELNYICICMAREAVDFLDKEIRELEKPNVEKIKDRTSLKKTELVRQLKKDKEDISKLLDSELDNKFVQIKPVADKIRKKITEVVENINNIDFDHAPGGIRKIGYKIKSFFTSVINAMSRLFSGAVQNKTPEQELKDEKDKIKNQISNFKAKM